MGFRTDGVAASISPNQKIDEESAGSMVVGEVEIGAQSESQEMVGDLISNIRVKSAKNIGSPPFVGQDRMVRSARKKKDKSPSSKKVLKSTKGTASSGFSDRRKPSPLDMSIDSEISQASADSEHHYFLSHRKEVLNSVTKRHKEEVEVDADDVSNSNEDGDDDGHGDGHGDDDDNGIRRKQASAQEETKRISDGHPLSERRTKSKYSSTGKMKIMLIYPLRGNDGIQAFEGRGGER